VTRLTSGVRQPAAEFDLHVHSSNSDGLVTPEDVIGIAQRAGVRGLVFTDHSGITFSADLLRLADAHGVTLPFPGVEVSTVHRGCKFHVLVYGAGIREPAFADLAFRPTAIKNEIYLALVDELRAEGWRLPSVDEMLEGRDDDGRPRHRGKWMLSKTLIGQHLVDAGFPDSRVREHLRAGYDRLKAEFPDRYVPTQDVIRAARDVQALPVLAHAWWECWSGRNTPHRVETQVAEFARVGLLGLEVVSRHFGPDDEVRAARLGRRFRLLAFAGSDFHGNGKIELGRFGLTRAAFERACLRAARRGCAL
jgi:3',5'-nucleoside bisphosphate phosphatase